MSVNTIGKLAATLKEVRQEELDITQSEAANRIGVSESTYRNWESGRNEPGMSLDEVVSRMRSTLTPTDRQGDPIYETPASAGDGAMQFTEEPVGHMPPSQSLSSAGRDVYWMPVIGDSMGEKYQKHTLVPVAKFTEPLQDIGSDDVYVIRLEGAIQIKRLQRLPGQRVRIISDNEAYPNEEIELDEGVDFKILGRVLV